MDVNFERDGGVIGTLFQQIINDMKVSKWFSWEILSQVYCRVIETRQYKRIYFMLSSTYIYRYKNNCNCLLTTGHRSYGTK